MNIPTINNTNDIQRALINKSELWIALQPGDIAKGELDLDINNNLRYLILESDIPIGESKEVKLHNVAVIDEEVTFIACVEVDGFGDLELYVVDWKD